MKQRIRVLVLLSIAFLILAGTAAHAEDERLVGVEVQAYPNGVISMLSVERELGDSRRRLTFGIGHNTTDRNDDGERDDEEGNGEGISVGWRTMMGDDDRGLFWGARGYLWFLEIDWVDNPGTLGEVRDTTDVLVLQPTAEVGYRIPFGKRSKWVFDPTVSLGVEINVDTDGEDVGEGPILLVGASVSRRF